MKNLSDLYATVKGWVGLASEQEISAQSAREFQEISEEFLKEFSKIRYSGPVDTKSVTIENVNEVYIHPCRPKLLTMQTNLRNPGGAYISVAVDFMEGAWGSRRLKRAVELLRFNLVSTVEQSPLLMGLNPRNFSVTKTGQQSGPKQDIYSASWHPGFSMNVVIVEAPHKWRAAEALEYDRTGPVADETAAEIPQQIIG